MGVNIIQLVNATEALSSQAKKQNELDKINKTFIFVIVLISTTKLMKNNIQSLLEKLPTPIEDKDFAEKCGFSAGRFCNYKKGNRTLKTHDAWSIVRTFNKLGLNKTFEDVFPPSDKEEASQ